MSELEKESKPYRYRGMFAPTVTAPPEYDTDRDALQSYINSLLGVKDPKSRAPETELTK